MLSAAIEALSTLPLPYCLIGALALVAYGRPRATHDVNLLILTDSAASHSYLDSLHAKGFAVASDWHETNPMAQDVVMRLTHIGPGLSTRSDIRHLTTTQKRIGQTKTFRSSRHTDTC